jgi:hypothetical protein
MQTGAPEKTEPIFQLPTATYLAMRQFALQALDHAVRHAEAAG